MNAGTNKPINDRTIRRRRQRIARLKAYVESLGYTWEGTEGNPDDDPRGLYVKVGIPGQGTTVFQDGVAEAEKWLPRFARWERDGGMVARDYFDAWYVTSDDQRRVNLIETWRAQRNNKLLEEILEAAQEAQGSTALAFA